MKLFYSPGACSLSPHIALAESGLAYSFEKVNLRAEPRLTESGADYRALNPKGYVPALQLDNGEFLTEGPAIVQYIADQAPERKLAPANGTLARYRLQEMLNFISTEVHKGFSPMFRSQDEAVRDAAWQQLSTRFTLLSGILAKQDYLLADGFSVADGYLFTCLGWASILGRNLDAWPVLQAYRGRIGERPAVMQAMREEGLL
ncbi:glutathione transferase GstA [Vogesella sp. LIG4]|uniref:glutathione transferase GstA n=1 Tax=Vogesella sp. LIG4 TaxID=1192162 RepID=UPI00081FF0C8|nr:glutathione transferase GstA [Vogesella sp. LIG4]SCK12496.1 glutathione S-transferase [Vogesella sp. LIG4]